MCVRACVCAGRWVGVRVCSEAWVGVKHDWMGEYVRVCVCGCGRKSECVRVLGRARNLRMISGIDPGDTTAERDWGWVSKRRDSIYRTKFNTLTLYIHHHAVWLDSAPP